MPTHGQLGAYAFCVTVFTMSIPQRLLFHFRSVWTSGILKGWNLIIRPTHSIGVVIQKASVVGICAPQGNNLVNESELNSVFCGQYFVTENIYNGKNTHFVIHCGLQFCCLHLLIKQVYSYVVVFFTFQRLLTHYDLYCQLKCYITLLER